jgi:hypothetical protein
MSDMPPVEAPPSHHTQPHPGQDPPLPVGAADPSSVLTISPRGSVAVATSELFEHAGAHESVAALASELAGELRRIDGLVPEAALIKADTYHGVQAEQEIERAIAEFERTAATCRTLASASRAAAEGYGTVEQANERSWLWLTDLMSYGAGALARLTMPTWIAPLLAIAGGLAVGNAAAHALGLDDEVGELLKRVGIGANGAYTNVPAVDALRTVAMGSDDAIAGFLGIPLPVQQALGDSGLGLLGLAGTAGLLRAGSSLLGTPETAPIVRPSREQPIAAPPSTITDLAARIPRTDDNGGRQITIEQYTMPEGSPRAVVLLAGTAEFTIGSDEPWDMGGNFSAVAGLDSSATMAIEEAIRQAGVDAATPIQLVGFSQGGAQAAVLAMTGQYNVQSVVTFGAPVGQLPIPESIPVLAVRHPDDLVASAAGGNETHAPNVFEVRNTAFAGQPVPTDKPAPAHQWDSYLRTAELMDADGSPELRTAIDQVLAFTDGAVDGTSTSFLARRGED